MDFTLHGDPAALALGPALPKPTSMTPGQREAIRVLWESADGRTKIGIRECNEGRFTADRSTTSETCHLLTGRATIHNEDGSSREVGAGDVFTLPLGWKGEWDLHEPIRKLFILAS